MSCRHAAIALSLLGLLSTGPGLANAELRGRPLQLAMAPASLSAQGKVGLELRVAPARFAVPANRHAARPIQAQSSVKQRALQSVLSAPEPEAGIAVVGASEPTDRFRFERQGSAIRDFSRGYREMCANVSNRIWDEPNGRRIKFDSAGKPGVAIVIPLR